jgi:regulator of protease activity HflC (stomatin/prohibitin superfamily)
MKDTLPIRGSDQYTTSVDISLIWRIKPGQCHRVALNFRDEDHVAQLVKNTMNKFANEVLAQLRTEDFYSSKVRHEKAQEAQQAMALQLDDEGIEIKYVLLRNIVYDAKFEAQLLQKQLAGQRKNLEFAKAAQARSQTQTELVKKDAAAQVTRITEEQKQEIANLDAETQKQVSGMLQDAQKQAAELRAKAESSRRQKKSQADLVKATAVAVGTEELSKAYSRPGASYYFARKAIEGMKLGEVEVNSNTYNPLDSRKLLEGLGLEKQDGKP